MHLDEIHVLEVQACAVERARRGEHGSHQQLLAGIERRVRVRPYIGERLVAECSRPLVAHQQHGARAVGQR